MKHCLILKFLIFIYLFSGLISKDLLTPLFTIWGSLFAKANAVYNPIVYAISHPKYRSALEKSIPIIGCGNKEDSEDVISNKTSLTTAEKT